VQPPFSLGRPRYGPPEPARTRLPPLFQPGVFPLDRLAGLLEDGTLSVPIQASYPLAQVDQALKDLAGQHTQGKLAVTLP
jgi:hypothetical protein